MPINRNALAVAIAVTALSFFPLGASAQQLSCPAPSVFTSHLSSTISQPQTGLFNPAPMPLCGPFCNTRTGGTTPTEQGSGTSCTNAQSSLTSQLQSIAHADCLNQTGFGTCNFVVTDTVACFLQSPGVYAVQGHATYNCRDTTC